jgi:acyl dehydratase
MLLSSRVIGDHLIGLRFDDSKWTWSQRDAILYALSCGADPTTDKELLSDRSGPRVLPLFSSVPLTTPWVLPLTSGLDGDALFMDQEFKLSGSLEPFGAVKCNSQIAAVWDSGRSAIINVVSEITAGDLRIGLAKSSLFFRGAGGFGGQKRGDDVHLRVFTPDRDPEITARIATRADQSVLFRTVGDYIMRAKCLDRDIHVDEELAKELGFRGPILPGLSVIGSLGLYFETLPALRDKRLREFKVRYLGVAYVGEDLAARIWLEPSGAVTFEIRTVDDGGQLVVDGNAQFDRGQ